MNVPSKLFPAARFLLLGATAAALVSCATDETADPAGENAFLRGGAPRYGAGGTMSPAANPGRYRVGETIRPGEYSRNRGRTVFLEDRRPEGGAPERSQNKPKPSGTGAVEQRKKPAEKKPEPEKKKKPAADPDPNTLVESPEVEKPEPGVKPAPKPSPKPDVTGTPDKPVATPVPGQPGMVYSPFDPQKRRVNVDGFPAGSEARCPYTKKIFLVP